jgi:hypothetical protein
MSRVARETGRGRLDARARHCVLGLTVWRAQRPHDSGRLETVAGGWQGKPPGSFGTRTLRIDQSGGKPPHSRMGRAGVDAIPSLPAAGRPFLPRTGISGRIALQGLPFDPAPPGRRMNCAAAQFTSGAPIKNCASAVNTGATGEDYGSILRRGFAVHRTTWSFVNTCTIRASTRVRPPARHVTNTLACRSLCLS